MDCKKPAKTRKRCAKDSKNSGAKLQKRKKSQVVDLAEGCSSEVVGECEADSEATLSDSSCCDNSDPWGQSIPELVLLKIFGFVVGSNGALPFLNR